MKKTMLFGIAAIVAGCFAVNTASAQIQWTPEQKAVWKTETTVGDLFMKGDLQGAFSYFDDSFQNWSPGGPFPSPVPKAIMQKGWNYLIAHNYKVDVYVPLPIVIWVNGNYAYTDYYSFEIDENIKGKKTQTRSVNMDVLIKKGDRWLIVGSLSHRLPSSK